MCGACGALIPLIASPHRSLLTIMYATCIPATSIQAARVSTMGHFTYKDEKQNCGYISNTIHRLFPFFVLAHDISGWRLSWKNE